MENNAVDLSKFKDYVKDFVTFLSVEKNVSHHTVRAYSGDLRLLASFWEKLQKTEPSLQRECSRVIHRYVISLYYQKIAKTSLARKFSCLRSLQKFLQNQGISLSIELKSPRLDKKLPATLTVDEVFYLLDTLKPEHLPSNSPYRDKAIFELLYATGVRCSELVGIKLPDIDFNEKVIKILGKGRRERIVLFGDKAKVSILNYKDHERAGVARSDKIVHLFLNQAGGPLTVRSVQRIFEMYRRFLKVQRKLTPHKIRHSFATHLLNEGTDLRIIQELLGHKTIATTEIYTHISSKHLARMCDEKHPLNKFKIDVQGEYVANPNAIQHQGNKQEDK